VQAYAGRKAVFATVFFFKTNFAGKNRPRKGDRHQISVNESEFDWDIQILLTTFEKSFNKQTN
jgi:hypothetical protein